mmetsp:Transcript_18403/g.36918  ORF Transcript_18403/g.36918 Transcript_18403/m.36918 type:complete len:320 (+) Transcript_18403:2456-3415(+)
MQCSTSLISINCSQFSPPEWQVTVTANRILIHQTMERTIHWFDLVHFILNIHLVKHSFRVKIKVSRSLPKVEICNVRSVNNIVTFLNVLFFPEIFNLTTNCGSFGVPKDQSTSCILLNAKQVQLLSKHTMITFLCLFHSLLVCLQLLRILPCSSINPLQHFTLFITTPVRTRNRLQRNSFLRKLPCGLHVWASTKIPPFFSNPINSNRLCFNGVKNLKLEWFSNFFDTPLCLFSRHLLTGNGVVFGDDLIHCLLHLLQVLITQFPTWNDFTSFFVSSLREVKVIVESIINPRPDGSLSFWECLLHCHGHDVSRSVTKFQ